ncbi:YEATS domain-containing protein 2 isoform X2 [Anastrepha obliqua]|uniref:YEATS domain-containing protein 2 isoform X2 n=1 Tax=Anastrepha obliqua TaxID=95512 RepID=UPI002409BE9C|nr:YEATS domain-containing protein 2 isoform X2 [Anastrepha obliqua]
MFSSRLSPEKRKHDEYYDPDYVRVDSSPSKKMRVDDNSIKNEIFTYASPRIKNISDIVSREFQNEITVKQQQLAEIEKRLDYARNMLDRLRFVIVTEYYRKQELSIADGDIKAVRGKTTLFEEELHGPYMPLHPSVKNVVGKRLANVSEVVGRPLPERLAAQNAMHTIRARSQTQKRQERRLHQLIRDHGLVIDHSKEGEGQLLEAAAVLSQTKKECSNLIVTQENRLCPDSTTPPNNRLIKKSTKALNALNAARLNNKTKQLIVIGNTSTYIGAGSGAETEQKTPGGNVLTHKWLVYVQSKDSTISLESFIKKVRFYLHPSFRPNDIVDIRAPPFQIARRGWGEFPMRIQLFFHDHLQQKPVQLIHNLVLDRTLSGMHTLGAETLMEIWLRTDAVIKQEQITPCIEENIEDNEEYMSKEKIAPPISVSQSIIDPTAISHVNTTTKHRTISFSPIKEELDDNIFGSPSKNAEVQTVAETVANILSSSLTKIIDKSPQRRNSSNSHNIETPNLSPTKNSRYQIDGSACSANNGNMVGDQAIQKESITESRSVVPTFCSKNGTEGQLSKLCETKPNAQGVKEVGTAVKSNKSMQLTTPMIMKLSTSNLVSSHNVTNNNKNKNNIIALSQVGRLMPLKIIAPSANNSPINVTVNKTGVLQTKLVQLVDAEGKVKFMRVLMAASQKPSNLNSDAKVEVGSTKTLVSVQNAISLPPSHVEIPTVTKSTNTSEKDASKQIVATRAVIPAQLSSTKKNDSRFQFSNSKSNVKSNTNTVCSPKQMVFQKEGKLFIIDPLQMKLKQEQRKQVSLLKPQANLQRQHQQQVQNQKIQSKAFRGVISDHDYIPSLNTRDSKALTTQGIGLESIKSLNPQSQCQAPELHFGIRKTRAKASNALELLQQRRITFEKDFLDQNIQSVRSAVDYLLHRLPLISPANTLAASFSFVSHNFKEFDALPVMKQRACEWLRAKYITRLVRNHKHCQELNSISKERPWSTREVLVYARHHAFTPILKSFEIGPSSLQPQPPHVPVETNSLLGSQPVRPTKSKLGNKPQQGQEFSQYVKDEVKFEQDYFQYESISLKYRITSWLNGVWQKLMNHEAEGESSEESVDIISTPPKEGVKINIANSKINYANSCEEKLQLFLPIPEHLEESSQLVSDICRDLNIKLQPEQIEQNVIFPSAQAVMAKCLNVFVEKLIRRAVALKQNFPIADNVNITTQDIGKVLVRNTEFDFLTNKNFGTFNYDS